MNIDSTITSDLVAVGRASRAAPSRSLDDTVAPMAEPVHHESSLTELLSLAPAYATRMGVLFGGGFASCLTVMLFAILCISKADWGVTFAYVEFFAILDGPLHDQIIGIVAPATILFGVARWISLLRAETQMRDSTDPLAVGHHLLEKVRGWSDGIAVATLLAMTSTFAFVRIIGGEDRPLFWTSNSIERIGVEIPWWAEFGPRFHVAVVAVLATSILVVPLARRARSRGANIAAGLVLTACVLIGVVANQETVVERLNGPLPAPPLALRTALFLVGTAALGVLLSTGWRLLWRAAPRSPRPS